MSSNDEILTLKDLANLLKLSKHTVYKNWHKWGIRPVVIYRNAQPRFLKSEVFKVLRAEK